MQVRIFVEAIKNICGVAVVERFEEYGDFNLRKFQARVTAEEGQECDVKDNEDGAGQVQGKGGDDSGDGDV